MATPVQVRISSDLPIEEREELLLLLRQHGEVEEETERDMVTLWHTFVVFLSDHGAQIGQAGAAVAGAVSVVDKLLAWRDRLRAKGGQPTPSLIQVARQGEAPEDLLLASPERVRQVLGAPRSSHVPGARDGERSG